MKRVFLAAMAALLVTAAAYPGGRGEKPATGPAMKAVEPATEGDLRMAKAPGKVLFSTLEDAQALAAKGPTVLFFAADWCPTCQAALKDINANGADLGGITVVVVDYDKEAELKKKYRVTYQHTFVQIDPSGKALDIWSGGGVREIVERLASM